MSEAEPGSARPPSMPPDSVLAAILPVGRFLIRSEPMAVALSHLAVFPNGCLFEIEIGAVAGGVGAGWRSVRDGLDAMVFAARFGTGIAAVMDEEEAWRARSRGEDRLVLVRNGYQSTAGGDSAAAATRISTALRLWLFPLPPPEYGTLSIVAPDLGPELSPCPLDGRAIAAAARQAQPYWP